MFEITWFSCYFHLLINSIYLYLSQKNLILAKIIRKPQNGFLTFSFKNDLMQSFHKNLLNAYDKQGNLLSILKENHRTNVSGIESIFS